MGHDLPHSSEFVGGRAVSWTEGEGEEAGTPSESVDPIVSQMIAAALELAATRIFPDPHATAPDHLAEMFCVYCGEQAPAGQKILHLRNCLVGRIFELDDQLARVGELSRASAEQRFAEFLSRRKDVQQRLDAFGNPSRERRTDRPSLSIVEIEKFWRD